MSRLVKVNLAPKGKRPFYTWGVLDGRGRPQIWTVNGKTWGLSGEQPIPRLKRVFWKGKRLTYPMFNRLPAITEYIDIIVEIVKHLFRKTHPPTYP